MTILSESKIKQIWEHRLSELASGETFNVYVANPFCEGKCSFCQYRSVHRREHQEAYDRYYNSFLPEQIETFSSFFYQRLPDTIYFGGGSPNAMSRGIMESIFSRIPRFKKIPNKVFENDPKLMDTDKLELLTSVDFSYVSFGVQSLDEETLVQVNREPCDEQFLKEIINEFQASGTRVNCDLMVYVGERTFREDISRVYEDARRLYAEFSPDFITVYPHFQAVSWKIREQNEKHVCEIAFELRKQLRKVVREFELYGLNLQPLDNPGNVDSPKAPHVLTRLDKEARAGVNEYDCSAPPGQNPRQNVLGLGGFQDQEVWSYHGRDFVYKTRNEAWEAVYQIQGTNSSISPV